MGQPELSYEEREAIKVKRMVRLGISLGAAAIAGIVSLFAIFGSFYSVDAGEMGVVTSFGAVTDVKAPGGPYFKTPFVQAVEKIGTRTGWTDWSFRGKDEDYRIESYSKDQQPAHLSVKVTYHLNADPKSVTTMFTQYKTVDGFANAVINPRTLEAVKTVFGQFNAVTAIQDRAALNTQVETAVRALIPPLVTIEGVQIQDISFSETYEQSIEQRMQAQVEVEKIGQNLERERKQAEIRIVQANASASAQVAAAQAEATSIKLKGEAEASAIKARTAALADSPKLVDLTLAEKWNGVLPTTVPPNGTVPFLPIGK